MEGIDELGLTRAQRSRINRARHAAEREAERQRQEATRAARAAERAEARRANRAAWWARYGMAAPEAREASEIAPDARESPSADPAAAAPEASEGMPRTALMRSCADVEDGRTWDVLGRDGNRYTAYEVEGGVRVVLPDGMGYEVPTLADASDLVDLAISASMDAVAGFEAGRSYTDSTGCATPVEVVRVSGDGSEVTYRLGSRTHRARVSRASGRAEFVAGGRGRYAVRIRADRAA